MLLFEPGEVRDFLARLVAPSASPAPSLSPSAARSPSVSPRTARPSPRTPPPSPSAVPTVPPAEVKAALDEVEELLEKGKAVDALSRLDALLSRPLPPFLLPKVKGMREHAAAFLTLQLSCERAAEGGEGETAVVKVRGGGSIEGKVQRKEDGSLVVVTAGGVRIELKPGEVEKVEPLSAEQWRARHRRTLENLTAAAKRAGVKSWLPWWKAFRFARRYDFNPEQWRLYREMASRFGDVIRRLKEYQARRLYRRALYFLSRGMERSAAKAAAELIRGYPDSSCAADAGELLERLGKPNPLAQAERTATPGRTSSPSRTAVPQGTPSPQPEQEEERVMRPPPADTPALKEANALYSKARAYIERAFKALDGDDYKRAEKLFDKSIGMLEKARALYEQAAATSRNRRAIEAFIEQVNQLIYLCRKSKPLGVWR